MLSVVLMCFGSLMIAVTPTYASIGLAAPILLGVARIIQGLSLGGEYGTSATYLTEVADHRHRGFLFELPIRHADRRTALRHRGAAVAAEGLPHHRRLRAWGWRIPFVIGAALAIIAAVMRATCTRPKPSRRRKTCRGGSRRCGRLFNYPREVLLVVGLTAAGTAAFYTYTTYMQKFLKLSVGLSDDQTTLVTFGSLVFAMILQPIYGAISDRIGRKWLLIGFGVAVVLFTIPLLTALSHAKGPLPAFLLIAAAWMIVTGYNLDQRSGEGRAVPHAGARQWAWACPMH